MDNNIPAPPHPTPAQPETVTAAAAPPATNTSSVQNRLRKPGSRAVPIVAPPDIVDSKDATQETPKDEEEKKEEGVVVAAVPAVAAAEPVAQAPNANGEQSDSGNEDSGNELSEPELADQMRVQPQGPGFAAALEKEKDEEKSRRGEEKK